MTFRSLSTTVAALGLTGLFLGGCCQKEKKEILELNRQLTACCQDRDALRAQLSDRDGSIGDYVRQLDDKNAEISRLNGELAKKPAPPTAGTGEGWTPTAVGDMATVGSDILFSSGSATLTSSGKSALDKIASDLRSTYSGRPIRVLGHTDNDPILRTKNKWTDNLDLSANRAMAVERHLISKGIEPKRIESVNMGEYHPIASNTTKDGKAKNRRVEIVVVKKP